MENRFSYIGGKIKKLMEERRVTYEELSRKSGKSVETIRLALNKPGARTLETMSAIADALGVSILYLLEPYPLEWDKIVGKMVKFYFRIPEGDLKKIQEIAEDFEVSKSEVARLIISQGLRMYRVLCPECDGVFWVEKDREEWRCPYCGAREEETIDGFTVQ